MSNVNNKNSIPKILFTPLKHLKTYFCIINTLSLIAIFFCFFYVDFKPDNLAKLSELTLNIAFVVGALGITIFSLKLDSTNKGKEVQSKEDKNKLILSYIGTILVCSSSALLGYILYLLNLNFSFSLFGFNITIIKLYCIVSLMLILRMLTSTLSTLICYFNVRY
ncbi:hypothetical protein SR42_09740 [Clostridium botulinum]|uniref:hypothetical protein n=1 Tax=Clostridium botulinum TaxID=1491 RepID=UPI000597536C|nr:hypothetical protein [Clostridium botulinum]KIL09238.1 hypothetical protein SR42_09740 [Clostridium botulinum]MBY6932937.1 hypothetical protein [Clostridium botulinum]NFL82269.1 hypothetical protein [Clostridium botulinum]NFN10782.1 hypothetical protein [Clostridium botulinum]NFO36085.1 hypothetical protein [Clostridium botulinum]